MAEPIDCAQPSDDGCPLELDRPVAAVLTDSGRPHAWRLTLTEGGGFRITLTELPADYDLYLNGPGVFALNSTKRGTEDEVIDVAWADPGDYQIWVGADRPAPDSGAPYRLQASSLEVVARDGAEPVRPAMDGVAPRTLGGHAGIVWSLSFAPDGSIIASGDNETVRLWRVADGTLQSTFPGRFGSVLALSFAPDGLRIASGSADGTARLWRVPDGTVQSTFPGMRVAFAPDGRTLASVTRTVRLLLAEDGALLTTLPDHPEAVRSVAFSPDGGTLASAAGATAYLWRVADAAPVAQLTEGLGVVQDLQFSPDGQTLAAGGSGEAHLWRVSDGALLFTLPSAGVVHEVGFAPDGQTLVAGTSFGAVQIWRVADGLLLGSLSGHLGAVYSVAFSPDGELVASGSSDHTIRLWRVGSA